MSESTQISATSATRTKQGHNYCGFCCDMRRAVLIVNVLSIVKFAIEGVMVAGVDRYARHQGEYEHDALVRAEQSLGGVIALIVVGNLVSFYAIYGAFFFRPIPLAIQIVYTVVYWLAYNLLVARATNDIVVLYHGWENWVGSLITGLLFLYPHVMLIIELRSGIMARATYPREKYSCCGCV